MVEVSVRSDDPADELPELDFEEHPDASLAALAASTPSSDTVVFSTFADPRRLSSSARIDLLQVLAKQAAWIEARQLELLAVIDAADPSPDRWATEEIAAMLRIAPATATVRVALARLLAGPLVATRQALLDGQITARHASVLAEAVRHLDNATATAVQDRVLGAAADLTAAEFSRRVRRAVLILDPAGQERRHCVTVEQRRVVITPDDDGMAQLWALLPAVGAATVGAALNALAAQTRHGRGGEARTADQRRADALVTWPTPFSPTRSWPASRASRRPSTSRWPPPPCSARTTNRPSLRATVRSAQPPRGAWLQARRPAGGRC